MNKRYYMIAQEVIKEQKEIIDEVEKITKENEERIDRAKCLLRRKKICIFSYETETQNFYILTCLKELCAFVSKKDGTCYVSPDRQFTFSEKASIRKFARIHGAKIECGKTEKL